jgi:hypothetical protein
MLSVTDRKSVSTDLYDAHQSAIFPSDQTTLPWYAIKRAFSDRMRDTPRALGAKLL